uniref:WD_REPEATS_REGION domain-containing protein n=1 Tax=Heterorhabditis bacteriophora TaxID=37862 RepID=A0A1I7XE77_HETBA
MSAVINPRPNSTGTNSSIGQDAKPILLHKIDGHVARVNDVILLSKEEGVWTASDDRSIRLYLKRDNGQFWPSIHRIMPIAATCIFYSEETTRLLVGLLNGHVYEYIVADDYNSMNDPESRKWSIHAGPVSGLGLALDAELVFSCSKDKSVVWHCSETGVKRGAFHCENSCTSLIIDLPFVFVGDHAGNVIVLRLTGDTAQLVSKLSAHTGPISSLAWNRVKEVLFSGSYDNLVIMWDIGGKRGEAYELNGHSSKITRLCVAPGAARLFSADDAGKLVCWDMSANRCLYVIIILCFPHYYRYIFISLTQLAVSHDLRSGVTAMHLQETLGRMATVSQNRVVMIWDVRGMF